jgi:tetratricopeptide (TPR) repeat protein
LDGSTSTDPDGTIASYSWIQTAGPSVVLNDANTNSASFTAPSVSVDTQLKFSLTVKDDKGESSSPRIATITVKAIPVLTTNMTTIDNMTATDDVSVLNDKGDALYNQEKYDEAIQYYDKALAIDPNLPNALNNKGAALDSLGKHDEAIMYYEKVLAVNSTDINTLYNRAFALAYLGRNEEALSIIQKPLESNPNSEYYLTTMAFILFNLERHDEAKEYYNKALKVDPNLTEILTSGELLAYNSLFKATK